MWDGTSFCNNVSIQEVANGEGDRNLSMKCGRIHDTIHETERETDIHLGKFKNPIAHLATLV